MNEANMFMCKEKCVPIGSLTDIGAADFPVCCISAEMRRGNAGYPVTHPLFHDCQIHFAYVRLNLQHRCFQYKSNMPFQISSKNYSRTENDDFRRSICAAYSAMQTATFAFYVRCALYCYSFKQCRRVGHELFICVTVNNSTKETDGH